MAKKRTKRARRLPESTAFIATSKMNKVEKLLNAIQLKTANKPMSDAILDFN